MKRVAKFVFTKFKKKIDDKYVLKLYFHNQQKTKPKS